MEKASGAAQGTGIAEGLSSGWRPFLGGSVRGGEGAGSTGRGSRSSDGFRPPHPHASLARQVFHLKDLHIFIC